MKRDLDAVMVRPPLSLVALATPAVLACLFAVAALLAVYWQTAATIVMTWYRSETFAHGFVVVPLSLWFVWRRRDELARAPAQPWWPGLIAVAAAGILWLVASAADVLVVREFALVFMLQAAIVTIVGLRVARAMLFPLAFLLFAVPAGDFLVPTLMDRTADFTVGALRLSGVPVYREGNHFVIPSGYWSVVEACSGVRYVIASVMVGAIFAAITYRSPRRRALFVLASIAVPVVANWLRAYMIVMIGHLSNNRLAVGVDHIIYGWVFFGLVMLLLFWLGSMWQEYPSDAPATPAGGAVSPRLAAMPLARPAMLWGAATAAVVAAGIWMPVDKMMGRDQTRPPPELAAIAGTGGWEPSLQPVSDWRPSYSGYVAELRQAYRNGAQDVVLQIAYYRNQVKGAELITTANLLTPRESWTWKLIAEGTERIDWAGGTIDVDRAALRGLKGSLEVFRLYRVAGHMTASPVVAKALLAWSRMTGGGDDAVLIILFAPVRESEDGARAALRSFAQAMAAPIDRALLAAEASGR